MTKISFGKWEFDKWSEKVYFPSRGNLVIYILFRFGFETKPGDLSTFDQRLNLPKIIMM